MVDLHRRGLAHEIAVGWILLLLVKTFSFSSAILFAIFERNQFQTLFGDPGPQAARVFVFVFWLLSLLPIYVCVADKSEHRAWRWPSLALSVAFLLFGLFHHWHHWSDGERSTFGSNIIDLMNHGVGLWLVFNSLAWVRFRDRPHGDAQAVIGDHTG